jgi:hypothetical protein
MGVIYGLLIVGGMAAGLAGKLAIDWVLRRKHAHSVRERIARWWKSGYDRPPESIEYRTREGVMRGKPIRATGLHLLVEPRTGSERAKLITAGDAVDRDEFWKVWKYFGGQLVQYVDEDGDSWEPE